MGEKYGIEERIARECGLARVIVKEILKKDRRGRTVRDVIYVLGSSDGRGMRAYDIAKMVGYSGRGRMDRAPQELEKKVIRWLQNIGVVERYSRDKYTLTATGEKLYRILKEGMSEQG